MIAEQRFNTQQFSLDTKFTKPFLGPKQHMLTQKRKSAFMSSRNKVNTQVEIKLPEIDTSRFQRKRPLAETFSDIDSASEISSVKRRPSSADDQPFAAYNTSVNLTISKLEPWEQPLKPPTQEICMPIYKRIVITPKLKVDKTPIVRKPTIDKELKAHNEYRNRVFSASERSTRSCSIASDKLA